MKRCHIFRSISRWGFFFFLNERSCRSKAKDLPLQAEIYGLRKRTFILPPDWIKAVTFTAARESGDITSEIAVDKLRKALGLMSMRHVADAVKSITPYVSGLYKRVHDAHRANHSPFGHAGIIAVPIVAKPV